MVCFSDTSIADEEDQRRRDAATVFRSRHHISQDDSLSVGGSIEDISGAVGRVELPASVGVSITGWGLNYLLVWV